MLNIALATNNAVVADGANITVAGIHITVTPLSGYSAPHTGESVPLVSIIRQPDSVGTALRFTVELLSFFVNPLFSHIRTEYTRQTYTRGSVVGKAKISD